MHINSLTKKRKPQYRYRIKNVVSLNDKLKGKLINKNVLILDDILTSSATIVDIARNLNAVGVNNIVASTIFK